MVLCLDVVIFTQFLLLLSESEEAGDIACTAFLQDPDEGLQMVIGQSQMGQIIQEVEHEHLKCIQYYCFTF